MFDLCSYVDISNSQFQISLQKSRIRLLFIRMTYHISYRFLEYKGSLLSYFFIYSQIRKSKPKYYLRYCLTLFLCVLVIYFLLTVSPLCRFLLFYRSRNLLYSLFQLYLFGSNCLTKLTIFKIYALLELYQVEQWSGRKIYFMEILQDIQLAQPLIYHRL